MTSYYIILASLRSIYISSLQWYAIALSNVGDYEGNKAKLQNAYTMKEHFEVGIISLTDTFIERASYYKILELTPGMLV